MNRGKSIIQTVLLRIGYKLVRNQPHRPKKRDNKTHLLLQNFENLAAAYELVLNQRNEREPIPANPTRARLLARLLGTPPAEAYFIIEALAATNALEGDVCEFGVAQGETSALIANEIATSKKHLHLFDSFEGLPRPSDKDQLKDDIFSLGTIEAYAGTMVSPVDLVLARLQAISFPPSRFTIHQGFIEELIHREVDLPSQVSFAYVDFDFYEPIKVTLDFLDRVTPRRAIIIVDDYNFFSTGAKTAVDEFVASKNSSNQVYSLVVPDIRFGYFAVLSKFSD